VAFGKSFLMDSHKLLGKGLRLFHIPTGPTMGSPAAKSENPIYAIFC
jgi:hypothetical protein